MGKWKGDRDFTTRLECRGSAEMVSVICEIWEKSSGSTVWAVMLLFNFCVDYTDIHSHMLCDRLSVQTGAIALVSWLMLFFFLENGRKASSYLLASERTKHLR
jgi:hypothetical protein